MLLDSLLLEASRDDRVSLVALSRTRLSRFTMALDTRLGFFFFFFRTSCDSSKISKVLSALVERRLLLPGWSSLLKGAPSSSICQSYMVRLVEKWFYDGRVV
jgi:hypothetical protein